MKPTARWSDENYDTLQNLGVLYDYVGAYTTRADVAFYVDEVSGADGKILELASGTGRVLLPIARSRKDIVGIERSRTMLDRCREKLAAEPSEVQARVQLHSGDMRDFSLDERFAAAIIPFRAMQHLLSVDDQLACLDCIRRHLVPGGRLVFDVFNPDFARLSAATGEEFEDTAETLLPDGSHFRRTGRIVSVHRVDQINEIELIYYVTPVGGGEAERRVHAFPMRWYLRFELEHLLARAGFTIDAIYGNFDRSPLIDESPEMIVAARAGSW
jgi:SAM-dependent methyltransferase